MELIFLFAVVGMAAYVLGRNQTKKTVVPPLRKRLRDPMGDLPKALQRL
jgi:hypothetical protein